MNLLLMLMLLFIGLNSYAQECTQLKPKTESAAEYLIKIAESLTHIKIQFSKISSLRTKKNVDATDAIVALKELKAGYLCAAKMISGYKKSKNENISQSSEALSKSYQWLSEGVDESISEIKQELDGKFNGSPGTKAERSADKMLDTKNKWEMVILGISLGTYAAVGEQNSITKKTDTLVIKKTEHDQIVKTLKSQFKVPSPKADSDPIDAAANIYFSFLSQPWKFK